MRLAERQITLSELRNVIRTRNQDVSGGDIGLQPGCGHRAVPRGLGAIVLFGLLFLTLISLIFMRALRSLALRAID